MDPEDLFGLGKPLDRMLGWFEKGYARVRGWFSERRAARAERSVVSQPVANPDLFEGRSDDLGRLGELFDARNVVWITGPPGIGKTALAGRFVRSRHLEGQAESFDLAEGSNLGDLLESINAFLMGQNCRTFEEILRQPGLTAMQRIPAFMRTLCQGDWVIVIESYEEGREVDEIGALLRQCQENLSGCRIVVTSQVRPGWPIGDRELPLGGLSPEASRKVLAELGIADGWERIHEAVEGCPKGLRVAAFAAGQYGVEAAVRAARDGEIPALSLYDEVYRRVSEPVQRMWAMLCMLPGPFDRDLVQSMWGDGNATFAWGELVNASVLDPRGATWQMHSLARAAAEKRRAGQRGWQKEYGRKIARYYAGFAKAKRQDRAAIEGELENLLAAARLAFEYREWEALWGTSSVLDDPLDYAGRWRAREELLRLGYQGAGKAGDRTQEGKFANNLGVALGQRGSLEAAEDLYKQSLEIEREVGDRAGQAYTLGQLGNVASARGDFEGASKRYRDVLAVALEMGDRSSEAKALHQLGNIACLRGKLEEAEGLYMQSLGIKREVGDRPGEAVTLHQLGIVAQQRGKLEEAEGFYNQSLVIKRQVGDRPGEAKTLHQLGTLAQDRGRLEEAEGLCMQSLEIKREVGDRRGEAITLAQMALLAEEQGNLKLAVERMEQACAMFEEMGLSQAEEARRELERLRGRLKEGSGGEV